MGNRVQSSDQLVEDMADAIIRIVEMSAGDVDTTVSETDLIAAGYDSNAVSIYQAKAMGRACARRPDLFNGRAVA